MSGIETVTMPGDYVVVVLQKDGKESGMPIGECVACQLAEARSGLQSQS